MWGGEKEYLCTSFFVEVYLVAGHQRAIGKIRCQPRAATLDSGTPTAPDKE
jgi:hypothetical protein